MGWGLGLQVQGAALPGGGLKVDFVGVAHGLLSPKLETLYSSISARPPSSFSLKVIVAVCHPGFRPEDTEALMA